MLAPITMKITGSSSLTTSGVGQGKRPPGGAFSLSSSDGAGASGALTRSGPVPSLGSIDALIALQEIEEPLARRRRAVARAGRLLDGLEQLKLALLDGDAPPDQLERLAAAARERREATDDPGLQAVLDQIETRAAVELAKLGLAGRA